MPTKPAHITSAIRTSWLVTALCWFALFSEGYDMGVLGAVLPSMMADGSWHLDGVVVGMMASAALVGMFFSGYTFGVIADRYGRKPGFLLCISLFSIASSSAALAPTPFIFAVCRFFAGIGVGGIVPIAASLTTEYALPGRANRQFGWLYSGYSVGIFAAAITSYFLVVAMGWRFVVGLCVLPLAAVPLIAWLLPESIALLRAKGRFAEADKLANRLGIVVPAGDTTLPAADSRPPGLRALLAPDSYRATVGFSFSTLAGMVLVYGLNTWLPQIMRSAGYELGPSILFLAVFALSSALGGVILGVVADQAGQARTIAGAFTIGAAAILALAHPWPLPVTYAIVGIAGVGSVAAAVLVTSYVTAYFPPQLKATAVGWCLSFSRFGAVLGPLLGGLIAKHHLDIVWNFVAFAGAALLAGWTIMPVPRGVRSLQAALTSPIRTS